MAASAGALLRTPATINTITARATSISEMPRWKRPASECGQGSSGLITSRPLSESVHALLRGQPLQMCALAR